ncbi:MAG: glycosyltransferase family 4 protein, partial [Gammaproteobacteria bacterium]
CADLGVLPSHQEGFSNSLLEMMAAGLPVIATDVGGNGEAIIDNASGLLVPPQDPKALGHAIARIAADPVLRRGLGDSARARMRECFSIERCAEEYRQVYTDLLTGNSHRL